jgi:hypothetical protein
MSAAGAFWSSWLSRLAGYYCLENKKAIQKEAGL